MNPISETRGIIYIKKTCVMSFRRRTNRKRIKIFEEKIAENLPNFMKNINLQIQEAQWISSKIIYT